VKKCFVKIELCLKGYPFVFFIFCSSFITAQVNPDIIWSKSYGGSEYEVASHVQPTTDGGFILIGVTPSNDGDVIGYHDFYDIWIVKLNSQGELEWERCYGCSSYDYSGNIKQTSDNGYIFCGNTSSSDGDVIGDHSTTDAWVVKIDSLGIIQWQKYYGGSEGDGFNDILISTAGYIFVGGTYSNDGDVDFNNGIRDTWIVSIDDTGKIKWEKTYGGTNDDDGLAAILTSDHDFVIASATYSDDGDLMSSNYHGAWDYWILKIDSNGSLIWSKCFGGQGKDFIESIEETSNGNLVVAGYIYSNDGDVSGNHGLRDYWVINVSSDGDLNWQKCLGGTNEDICHSATVISDNGIIAAGTTLSTDGDVSFIHDPNGDAWIVKLDSLGNIVWGYSYGGSKGDGANDLIQTADGSYVFCGGTRSNDYDLTGNTNHGYHGYSDYWIAKLSPSTLVSYPSPLNFSLSPNPSSTYINIVYSIEQNATLTFTDAYGRVAKQLTFYPYFKNRIIYTDDLSEGVYLVTVREEEKYFSKKLVVAR